MASGVRLRHPTLRNATFTVEAVDRPYRSPVQCPVCHEQHFVKTYHLSLDAEGTVIVSPDIFERLQAIPGMAGLVMENEVKRPPAQTVGVGGSPNGEAFKVVRHEFEGD